MSEPFFSIIIPAYNEEKHLSGCLESIANLNYPEDRYEVIVVDNGSTDSTRAIAKNSGAKVLRDDNRNVSGLRNIGAKESMGDILAFVDADCVVSTNWLIHSENYFGAAEIVAWGAPAGLPENSTWVQRTWYLVRQKDKRFQEVDWLETMNLFVRRKQFLDVGGFNEDLVTCEDVDFSYRMRKYGKIVSDSSLKVIHLGEAGTLKEFVKKEIWRGTSNLLGIFSHGISIKELPSLSIPVYFGLFLPLATLIAVFLLGLRWIIVIPLFILLPSVVVIFKARKKIQNSLDLFKLLVLLQFYFFSRTIAVLKKN